MGRITGECGHKPIFEALEPRLLLDGAGAEAAYLLITNEALSTAFQDLVDRREDQGLTWALITVDDIYLDYDALHPGTGADNQTKIRDFIIDYYNNHDTKFVAFGGDETVIPVRLCGPYDWPSDAYYADVDGQWDQDGNGIYGEGYFDCTPEVALGRIPVRTTGQAEDYIAKVIQYENLSPEGFADSMLIMGGTDGEYHGTDRPDGYLDHDPVSIFEWYEQEVYYGSAQEYWQAAPKHVYYDSITSWDTVESGDYGLTYQNSIDVLSYGYHHVSLLSHGSPVHTSGLDISIANGLTNADRPSIFFIGACTTAGFDAAEPSLSEALIRNPNGGAVAYIGYLRSVHWEFPPVGQAGFYRELYRNNRETIGEAFLHHMPAGWQAWQVVSLQGDPALRILGRESGRELHLDSPHGAETYDQGVPITVRWSASGTDFQDGELVDVEYSDDDGQTWQVLPDGQGDDLPYDAGYLLWETNLPPIGDEYRFRVTSGTDPAVSDDFDCARAFRIADMVLLTVKSTPQTGILLNKGESDKHAYVTDYNHTVEVGREYEFKAPPVIGYDFVRWSDGFGLELTTDPNWSFEFTGDATIVAEYELSDDRREYYVNDDDNTGEDGFALGNDANDGLSPMTPVRNIQTLIDRHTDIGTIHLAPGTYRETLKIESKFNQLDLTLHADDDGITIRGSGQGVSILDAQGDGAALTLDSALSIEVENMTIRNGDAGVGGGVWASDSQVTFRHVDFLGNSASVGGALGVYGDTVVSVDSCNFADNEASSSAGAIYVNSATADLTVRDSVFRRNAALASCGGAIWVGAGRNITISGSTFEECTSASYGGAVHLSSGSGLLERNTFVGNHAAAYGGAMVIYAPVTIRDSIFLNNTSDYAAGAVYWETAEVLVERCLFDGNSSASYGGALAIYGPGTVRDSVFRSNSSVLYGGVLIVGGNAIASIDNCDFVDNEASSSAGAIYVYYADLTVRDCEFTRNAALGAYGGAIWVHYGKNVTILDSTFEECTSGSYGGAVHLSSCTGLLERNTFLGNSSASYGGALAIFTSVTVRDSVFCGNSTGGDGGGVYANALDVLFAGNTLVQNHAGNAGGGVAFGGIAAANVEDTILRGNIATSNAQLYVVSGGVAHVTFSNVEGIGLGDGNMDEPAGFVRLPDDGGDGWGVGDNDDYGDLHLTAGSACINVGDPGGDYTGRLDIDGQPRVAHGRVDIGADEHDFKVLARHIFYNNSSMDGDDIIANAADDDAIDPGKQALSAGGAASPVNYTSYFRGINGIMLDIANMPAAPVVSDFEFRVSDPAAPGGWTAGPVPTITVRLGQGVNGIDRVTLIWTDGAILNKWLEVRVNSAGGIGLEADDVFYFANAVADCDGDGEVGSSDYVALVGEFGRSGDGLATDFNGDGRVDLVDFAILRGTYGNSVSVPTFPPAAPEAPLAAPVTTLQTATEPIAETTTPMVSVISQTFGDNDANDDSIAAAASAPAVDLLVESLLPVNYISGAQPMSVGSSATTFYRAATAEYDLRPLGDDLAVGGEADELLADILAESPLAVPL